MRSQLLFALCLLAGVSALAQASAKSSPPLPKDPRALFAAAAPFYDFSDPALKPWHLKVSYQLYDDKGKPTEQGTFEYWWASPKVYRVTLSRPGVSHTDWYTADGKHAYLSTGKGFSYFEYRLQSSFLSPLPDAGSLDSTDNQLVTQNVKVGKVKLPCIMVAPKMSQYKQTQKVPLGLFPTYCFDQNAPALRFSYSFGTITEIFNSIAKVQGRYLPKDIAILDGKRELLSAKLELVEGLASSDPAFTPDPHKVYVNIASVKTSAKTAAGWLVKTVTPIYPQDAKDAHVSGTVVLNAVIGRDGRVHELQVVETPWPSLAASAMSAVSRWEYKPYLLNGEPVEVHAKINVIYHLRY